MAVLTIFVSVVVGLTLFIIGANDGNYVGGAFFGMLAAGAGCWAVQGM